MSRVRRWAAAAGAVAILTAGWTTPAQAGGEPVPTTMWLYAWAWDWVTWADEFTWDMVGLTAGLANDLTSDEVGSQSTSYTGDERFYWQTGFGPTSSPITGMSVVYDHVALGSPGGSSTIRFTCGRGNSKANEGRFIFHNSWVHFTPPTQANGGYIEMFAAYHCGPSTSDSYYRYKESQVHSWSRDAEGRLVRTAFGRRGPYTTSDFDAHRYRMEWSGARWNLYFPGQTAYFGFEPNAPTGRAMNWGLESNFDGGSVYHGHVAVGDTRHQYGEGNGYFPHSQNGFNAVQEAPWGGHISVYRNAEDFPYYNGVHVCTQSYSPTCGG